MLLKIITKIGGTVFLLYGAFFFFAATVNLTAAVRLAGPPVPAGRTYRPLETPGLQRALCERVQREVVPTSAQQPAPRKVGRAVQCNPAGRRVLWGERLQVIVRRGICRSRACPRVTAQR